MSDQLYLPYVRGSETSKEAADSLKTKVTETEGKVFNTIRKTGNYGATCWEIENVLDMRHQTASARIRGLYLKGLIYSSGDKRRTDSGRQALVWRVS